MESYDKQQKNAIATESPGGESLADALRKFSLKNFYEARKHLCSFCFVTIPPTSPRYGSVRTCDRHFRMCKTVAAHLALRSRQEVAG